MKPMLAGLSLLVSTLFAQSGIAPPRLGFMQDSAGALRPVFGVTGNFTVGDAIASPVISFAFSGQTGFFKTDSNISVFDGAGDVTFTADAPAGFATYSFRGPIALLLFTDARQLWRWTGTAFETVPFDLESVPGELLSLAQPDATHLQLAVRREDGKLWSILFTTAGEMQSQAIVTEAPDAVLAMNTGEFVLSTAGSIVLHRPDGSEMQVNLGLVGPVGIQEMAAGWFHVQDDAGQNWALRLKASGLQPYLLPETEQ